MSTAPRGWRRHLKRVEKSRVVELWQLFANGDVAAFERLPWEGGNGWVETPEWRLTLETQGADTERELLERMGPEDSSLRCRHEGCARGQTRISHFCRVHNFEAMRGKPCPFSD